MSDKDTEAIEVWYPWMPALIVRRRQFTTALWGKW
jgi:hypothetical protein